jgi:Chaperone of endosialidase/Secretion system C-terminal sorting domain
MKRLSSLLVLLLFVSASVQAQFPCTNLTNVIPCNNLVLGQLNAGAIGSFTAADEWTTIGKAPFPVPGTGDFPYGQRYQRGESTSLIQMEARNGAPTIIDGVVGIGVVRSGVSTANLPRLDFDYIYQNQGAIPPSITKVKVMTITGNTSKPVGGGLTALCFPIGSPPCYGRVGIENTAPSYTLDVNGLLRVQTTIYTSDARFKNDVKTIENGMDVIQNLRGTTYTFKDEGETPGFNFGPGLHAGFIAQEVEKVLPHLVYTDEQGYKGVDYVSVIPYLVQGFQEMADQNAAIQQQNEELATQNRELQAQIQAVLNQGGASSSKGNAAGGSLDGTSLPAELFQNVPNPFNNVTEIRYSLPETVRAASLLVFDMNGKQLRSFDISERGLGNVRIAANELSSGMYLYTLLADGKEVGTRRMIITE